MSLDFLVRSCNHTHSGESFVRPLPYSQICSGGRGNREISGCEHVAVLYAVVLHDVPLC